MAKNIHAVIIDPQNDFCVKDGPDGKKGALVVPGALDDMKRAANMIRRLGEKLDKIHVILDSHHLIHVAHPICWRDKYGKMPNPFTIISYADVANGVWTPFRLDHYRLWLEYTKKLENNGRYPLCIWPPHCLIGTWGNNVVDCLCEALLEWEFKYNRMVDFVTKGSNYKTEHYSALMADVPDPDDPGTQLNKNLVRIADEADIVITLGEAGSHCLANTMRDMVNNIGTDLAKKFVIATDGTSPVPSFEASQQKFFDEMVAAGVQLTTTTEFLS